MTTRSDRPASAELAIHLNGIHELARKLQVERDASSAETEVAVDLVREALFHLVEHRGHWLNYENWAAKAREFLT